MAEAVTPDTIAENANGAQTFTSDGQTAAQVPVGDQIAAAKFAAANKPSGRTRKPLLGARYVPVVVG